MVRDRKNIISLSVTSLAFCLFLTSCANLPLIGKKKNEKADKTPEGKTVTIEGMGKDGEFSGTTRYGFSLGRNVGVPFGGILHPRPLPGAGSLGWDKVGG